MTRRIIIIILVLLGLYFIFTRQNEVEQIITTLQQGDWRWLAIALVVQIVYLLSIGASFKAIYRLLGMNERIERLTLLAAAANFVIVVAPTAGMGGIAVFASDAQKRGHSTGRATTAAAVYLFFDYLATLMVVLLGLFVLFRRNQLHGGEITATLILLVLAVGLGILLYLGMRSGEMMGNALAWMAGVANRIMRPLIKRDYFDINRAHEFSHDAAEGLRLARKSPGGLTVPLVLGLVTKLTMMTILMLMFMAFSQPFSAGIIIAGFSIGYLFTIVSPTPSGIGFVETAMTLTLNSLGVPFTTAALIVLAYRGFTLWLVIAYGMIAIRWVGRGAQVEEAQSEASASTKVHAASGAAISGNPHRKSSSQQDPPA